MSTSNCKSRMPDTPKDKAAQKKPTPILCKLVLSKLHLANTGYMTELNSGINTRIRTALAT